MINTIHLMNKNCLQTHNYTLSEEWTVQCSGQYTEWVEKLFFMTDFIWIEKDERLTEPFLLKIPHPQKFDKTIIVFAQIPTLCLHSPF